MWENKPRRRLEMEEVVRPPRVRGEGSPGKPMKGDPGIAGMLSEYCWSRWQPRDSRFLLPLYHFHPRQVAGVRILSTGLSWPNANGVPSLSPAQQPSSVENLHFIPQKCSTLTYSCSSSSSSQLQFTECPESVTYCLLTVFEKNF